MITLKINLAGIGLNNRPLIENVFLERPEIEKPHSISFVGTI
jgi:hypothetical protein